MTILCSCKVLNVNVYNVHPNMRSTRSLGLRFPLLVPAWMHVCMWRESLGSFPFRKTHPFLVPFKILNTPDPYNDSACIYHARDLRYIVTCPRVLYNKSWTLSNSMDANKPVKWGICGLGNISRDFCTIICSLPPEKHQVCVSYQPSLCHRAFCRVLSVQFSASKNS